MEDAQPPSAASPHIGKLRDHFADFLEGFAPSGDLLETATEAVRRRLPSADEPITTHCIDRALRALDIRGVHKLCVFCALVGEEVPFLTNAQRTEALAMFDAIYHPYKRHAASIGRRNFFRLEFCLGMFALLRGWDRISETCLFVSGTTTKRNQLRRLDIWDRICADLGWSTRPSKVLRERFALARESEQTPGAPADL